MKVIRRKLWWSQAMDAMHQGQKVRYPQAPEGWYIVAPTPGRHRYVTSMGREYYPTQSDQARDHWQVVE